MDQKDLKDQIVLVTGAAMGIGQATALSFAQRKARLVLSDRNPEEGQKTLQLVKNQGAEAIFVPCDVSKPEQVKALFQTLDKQFGGLDIAINNAGVEGESAPLAESSLENWDRVIGVNLRGLFLCLKEEIPLMRKRGQGAIVNLSSIAGLVGFPGLPAYVASKHGVIGLTKTAALECATDKIRVNAVCPGPILTPMLERLMGGQAGLREGLEAGVPQKRIGRVEEVAEAIVFLASPAAGYITGQALAMDGGWVAQ